MTTRFLRERLATAALATLLLSGSALSLLAAPTDDVELNSLAGTYLAARTADVDKDIPSAARFYRTALESDPDNLFLRERALILSAAAGEFELALEYAEGLVEEAPTSHAARLVLAAEQIRTEDYAEAVETLQESGNGVLADLTSGLALAWARFGAGEAEKALEELEALDGEEWYEPFKLLHGGYIAAASGDRDQALDLFGQAEEVDPNAIRITEAYARALANAGRSEEAKAALEDFLLRFPDNALARAALTDIEAGGGGDQTVDTPSAGIAEALAGIGTAVGQEGGVEAASLYLRLALYLDPNTAGGLAALSLGNLLDTNGQGEAAIEVFESIPAEQAFRALGALRAALALDRMDRTEEAEAAFREAMRGAPDDIQPYISYGNMLRGRERYMEAADIYSEAIARIDKPGPADWSLYYFRGIAYERTKAWQEAEADFREALALQPDQPLVMNYLGYSLVDMGQNLGEALDMIRKAVELRPNDGYIVDSLGWAYYRLGRYDEAVTELERAVALRSDDPVIHDHLGDAYWKAGRNLEAQFQWRHARDFGAEGEELELILKKIAEQRLIEAQRDASLYIVQPGDSLWTISTALLDSDNAFERLLEANRDQIESPDQIYPGMQLRIPDNI